MLLQRSKINYSSGFTLAEVTIAILVLSSAVITLISLQSASLESTFRDERRQVGLLAARAIFSALEIQEEDPEDIDVEQPLIELLQKRSPLDGLSDWSERKRLEPFMAHLTIKNWPVPLKGINQDALKRATIRIYWSNAPADSISLDYFIPKKAP
jgi:type II secretory pathway pseudopilin PulG